MVGANGVGHNACAARQVLVWGTTRAQRGRCGAERQLCSVCMRSGGGAVAGQPTGVRSALVCGDDRFRKQVRFLSRFR